MKLNLLTPKMAAILICYCQLQELKAGEQPGSKTIEQIKNSDKDATSTYLETLKAIENEQSEKIKRAQKKYIEELESGIQNAITKRNLPEANRLTDLKNNILEEMKLGNIPLSDSRILFAIWGAKSNWINVTSQLHKFEKEKKLPIIPEKSGFPDPAIGTFKSLIIVYTQGKNIRIGAFGHDELAQPGRGSINPAR